MIHIRYSPEYSAMCGVALEKGDTLVDAALASDCDACRVKVGVGPKGAQQWSGGVLGVHPEPPAYEPRPMKDIESLEEIRARRDGR